jgi:hypothetical protein
MKDQHDDINAFPTLPPSPAQKARTRTLLEQLADLAHLPQRIGGSDRR